MQDNSTKHNGGQGKNDRNASVDTEKTMSTNNRNASVVTKPAWIPLFDAVVREVDLSAAILYGHVWVYSQAHGHFHAEDVERHHFPEQDFDALVEAGFLSVNPDFTYTDTGKVTLDIKGDVEGGDK